MITDFQILGIEATDDISLIKSAFRKRAKELHPDLSTAENALRRHDLFMAVSAAYRRLLEGRAGARPPPEAAKKEAGPAAGLAVYADQAYAFYKQGMKAFMAIHPSHWVIDDSSLSNERQLETGPDQEETRRKVAELAKLFPKAYYYFSIVANEHPDSAWAYDAREKMGKIEERIKRYRKILESFSSWTLGQSVASREHRARYLRHEEARRAVRKDGGKGWEGSEP